MKVQIDYYERKTVLTNLMISKEQNIPVLQIRNITPVDNQNTNVDVSFAMDHNEIIQ